MTRASRPFHRPWPSGLPTLGGVDGTGHRVGAPRALVVGAGVGGLAASIALHRSGWDVVVCERSARRRTGGYFLRLAPEGVAAADRLGAGRALRTRLPADGVVTGVDRRGRTVSRVDASLGDDPAALALVRGDLEGALWASRPPCLDVRFGTGPRSLADRPGGVDVVLGGDDTTDGAETYDLVVGADGVRSTVRRLVFGPDDRFRREFDHVVISAVLPRLPGELVEGDYVVLAEPGRTAHLMAMSGHDPVVFFTYRADRAEAAAVGDPRADPVAALRAVYGDFAGLMPEILDGVAEVGATHADTVGQIHLERWSRGRVVLLGDAAWCPTLYSGQGSALALTGGESLAEHLDAYVRSRDPGDLVAGLASWEVSRRPSAHAAGTQARRSRHFFLPSNRVIAALRAAALRVASWPPAGRVLQAVASAGARCGARGRDVHPKATPRPGAWRPAALDRS